MNASRNTGFSPVSQWRREGVDGVCSKKRIVILSGVFGAKNLHFLLMLTRIAEEIGDCLFRLERDRQAYFVSSLRSE
jgi:hypothetical protein